MNTEQADQIPAMCTCHIPSGVEEIPLDSHSPLTEELFHEYYNLHARSIRNFILSRLLGHHKNLVDDVVQQTWLAYWNRGKAWRTSDGSLFTYLCSIAKNKVIDLVRHHNTHDKAYASLLTQINAEKESGISREHAPEPRITDAELDAILHAISSLRPEHSHMLQRVMSGMSHSAIGISMRIPRSTVTFHIHNAIRELRSLLHEIL